VLSCALDPTIRILNVSGEFSPATFTPDAKYNFYTITGCSFGDPGPNSKVYIYYQDIFHQNFQVQEWNDNGIKINLNPSLRGLLDQDNLTLVVQRADGKQATKNGFKFYAARDEVLLSFVPAKEASLAGPELRSNFPFFQSPGFGTFDVQRNAETTFSPGTDHYSFDGLQRGFVPVAFQASRYAPLTADQCNYVINRTGMQISFDGQWNAQWEGNRLRIDWPVAHCYAPGGARSLASYNEWAAWYGTKIWVSGPRGIDPWPPNYRLAPAPVALPNPHGF